MGIHGQIPINLGIFLVYYLFYLYDGMSCYLFEGIMSAFNQHIPFLSFNLSF